MNIFTKFAQWHLTKQFKKQQSKKQIEEFKKNKIVYNNLRQLYTFVHWLNTKGLSNRHQRKSFWAKVKAGEPILEKTINNIAEQYRRRITPVVKKIEPKKINAKPKEKK